MRRRWKARAGQNDLFGGAFFFEKVYQNMAGTVDPEGLQQIVDTGLFVTFEPNLCSLTQQRGQKPPNYLKIQTKLWLCTVAELPPYLFGPQKIVAQGREVEMLSRKNRQDAHHACVAPCTATLALQPDADDRGDHQWYGYCEFSS